MGDTEQHEMETEHTEITQTRAERTENLHGGTADVLHTEAGRKDRNGLEAAMEHTETEAGGPLDCDRGREEECSERHLTDTETEHTENNLREPDTEHAENRSLEPEAETGAKHSQSLYADTEPENREPHCRNTHSEEEAERELPESPYTDIEIEAEHADTHLAITEAEREGSQSPDTELEAEHTDEHYAKPEAGSHHRRTRIETDGDSSDQSDANAKDANAKDANTNERIREDADACPAGSSGDGDSEDRRRDRALTDLDPGHADSVETGSVTNTGNCSEDTTHTTEADTERVIDGARMHT